MAAWRVAALQRLPELKHAIESADSVMALWIEIWLVFMRAYERSPRDEPLISRVYSYADWCAHAPRGPDAGHDPSTAAALCFHEHLPTFGPSREDMPRWVSLTEAVANKEIYSHLIGEADYKQLLSYLQRNRYEYKPHATQSE